MLKTIPKYLIREHVGPFLFALFVITLLFLLNIVYRDLGKFLSKGLAFNVIVEFMFLNLAWMIALAVPMAVLTASIMAFGRLSADNEITAMKAGGVSMYNILLVMLALSTVLAVGLIWFNNAVLPDFNHRLRILATDISRKKPMINLEPGIVYSEIPNISILVHRVDETDSVTYIRNVIIDDHSESYVRKTISADSGEIVYHRQNGILEMVLFDGEIHEININEPNEFKKLEFPKHRMNIPLSEMLLIRTESEYRGDREKSAAALMEDVRRNREKKAHKLTEINKRVREQLVRLCRSRQGNQALLTNVLSEHRQFSRQLKFELDMVRSFDKSSDIYLVEVHKKYSIPAACLVFVMIGAPLGIRIRKKGWAVAGGMSLGFFLLYWAFLIGGEILADRQIVHPWLAMWSPNIVVGLFGIYLVRQAVRGQ